MNLSYYWREQRILYRYLRFLYYSLRSIGLRSKMWVQIWTVERPTISNILLIIANIRDRATNKIH